MCVPWHLGGSLAAMSECERCRLPRRGLLSIVFVVTISSCRSLVMCNGIDSLVELGPALCQDGGAGPSQCRHGGTGVPPRVAVVGSVGRTHPPKKKKKKRCGEPRRVMPRLSNVLH